MKEMKTQNNLDQEIFQEIIVSLDSSYLNLFILPTEKCNFRCFYCYEDYKIGRMKSDVISGIKNLLLNRAKTLKFLEVSWFGGEPLLAKDIIFDISKTILGFKEQNFNYTANITTNGYFLTLEVAEKMIDLGITTYQISLDGDEALHNNTRILSNGSGSFDIIMSNLLSLKQLEADFTVFIRVHYQKSTFLQLENLINLFNNNFGKDLRFKLFFKSIEKLGSSNDKNIETLTTVDKAKIENYLKTLVLDPRQISSPAKHICYASKPNSLVIRANGRIAKCTVALNDEQNDIGYLQEDGKLILDQNKLQSWMRGLESLDLNALVCPYANLFRN